MTHELPRFEPILWTPPRSPGLEGPYARNRRLAGAELWPVGGIGPEDVVVDDEGRVYAGLEDGRIVRFAAEGGEPRVVADTGGRPLGLELAPGGGLIVCDARKGLLRMRPGGKLEVLADSFGGSRLRFTNNAAVAADGTVFFTDSSRRYSIEKYKLDLLEHSGTGRLLVLRPGGRVELLLDGLQFANGVALAADESFLLVAETATYSMRRYWLSGERAGSNEPFVDNLPGFPDNLSRAGDIFWLAIVSPRDAMLDRMLPRRWPRRIVARLPERLQPRPKRHGFLLGFDAAGRVRHNLQDPSGRVAIVTGARQHGSRLFLGSLSEPAIAVVELQSRRRPARPVQPRS